MKTNRMELNMNEMEMVNGGFTGDQYIMPVGEPVTLPDDVLVNLPVGVISVEMIRKLTAA